MKQQNDEMDVDGGKAQQESPRNFENELIRPKLPEND